MLIFGIIAGLVLLYSCANELVKIGSYLKDIRSSAGQIQLETEGLLQRQAALGEALEEFRNEIKQISSVAESYEDEVLRPMRRAHSEAELFRDM